ncbi:MAG: DUF4412 domain-containing protein [Candidatus Schekmanbacteria bacterium]|nr:DUF4412 domain-containing protein [Candidatus Schekmanbacteria bacterium]
MARLVSFALVAALILCTVSVVAADTKIVKMRHTDAYSVMGQAQPAKDEDSTVWLGPDRMQVEQSGMTFIVRLDQKAAYMINHAKKVYSKLDLPLDLNKMMPPGMAQMAMSMMNFKVSVTPLGQSKKVGSWFAKGYKMTMTSAMSTMESTVWATTDVKVDLSKYKEMMKEFLKMQPGMAEMARELEKIEGLQVESAGSMTVMGGTKVATSERTTSIAESEAPASGYEPPAGYEDRPFDFATMVQQKQGQ